MSTRAPSPPARLPATDSFFCRRRLANLRPVLFLLLLTTPLFGSGCATTRPYYSGYYFQAPALIETDRSALVVYLDGVINQSESAKKLAIVTPEKGLQNLVPRDENSPGTIDWLPLPVLFATRYMLNPKWKGLEVDLLVHTEADGYTPVQARQELDGSVRVEMGVAMKTLFPDSAQLPSRQELSRRFGLGPIVDGTQSWQPLELYALGQALELLAPAELAAIGGISFVRDQRATDSSKGIAPDKLWGQYRASDGERTIHLFDTEPGHDTAQFVGEPSHPYPITTMCLLHELGHAIADFPRLEVVRARSQRIAAYNQLVEKWNANLATAAQNPAHTADLEQQLARTKAASSQVEAKEERLLAQYKRDFGPVHAAYRLARGPDKGPTAYGKTDIEESFAESFALAKADPAALRRIYPALPDWFGDGSHLQALRDGLVTDPASDKK